MKTEEVEAIAKIAGAHSKAVVELLIEKGVFTKEELKLKTMELSGLTEVEFNNLLCIISQSQQK